MKYIKKRLTIDKVVIDDIAKKFGTPTYCYSYTQLKKVEPELTIDVFNVFDLNNSISSKKSYGGTSFENIKKMIMKYKKQK